MVRGLGISFVVHTRRPTPTPDARRLSNFVDVGRRAPSHTTQMYRARGSEDQKMTWYMGGAPYANYTTPKVVRLKSKVSQGWILKLWYWSLSCEIKAQSCVSSKLKSSKFKLKVRILKFKARSIKLEARSAKLKVWSSKLKTQSSKLKAQSSKLEAQSSKLKPRFLTHKA